MNLGYLHRVRRCRSKSVHRENRLSMSTLFYYLLYHFASTSNQKYQTRAEGGDRCSSEYVPAPVLHSGSGYARWLGDNKRTYSLLILRSSIRYLCHSPRFTSCPPPPSDGAPAPLSVGLCSNVYPAWV